MYPNMNNTNEIQGNNNIVIQGVSDSTITLTVNGATQEIQNEVAVLRELMEKMSAQTIEMAGQFYDIKQLAQANQSIRRTFNVLFTRRITEALAQQGITKVQEFLAKAPAGWEHKEKAADWAKNHIISAFVGVLSLQMRELVAEGKKPISEDKQRNYIQLCYTIALRSLQLINAAMLSALWTEQKKNKRPLNKDEDRLLRHFFESDMEHDLQDCLELLRCLLQFFQNNQLASPIIELQSLLPEMQAGGQFYRICERIQTLKQVLNDSAHSIATCFEMEAILASFLSKLAFLVHYKMVSVKEVSYDEVNNAPASYLHNYIVLGIDQKFSENAHEITWIPHTVQTDSILLYRNTEPYMRNVNLFPFVVDFNTLKMESGANIGFFMSFHSLDNGFFLRYHLLSEDTYQQIEFKNVLQGKSPTEISEFLLDRDNQKRLKLDRAAAQFAQAQKDILWAGNSAASQQKSEFDGMFD